MSALYAKVFGNLDIANRSPLQQRQIAESILKEWNEKQGVKIRQARAEHIFAFVKMEAKDRAEYLCKYEQYPPLRLTTDEIDLCENRAVSHARMAKYGAGALRQTDGGVRWLRETSDVRSMLRRGEWPEGRRA